MNQTRQPVCNGSFYPAEKNDLIEMLNQFENEDTPHSPNGLRGVILPHAGYIYSGQTTSYARADLIKSNPDTIILLGPDHHVGMEYCHISTKKYFQTPLGSVELSDKAQLLLNRHPNLFHDDPRSDAKEHSLEVILPFLQHWLNPFTLLPIVTAPVNEKHLEGAIMPLVNEKTVLVISSDLSHFLSDEGCCKKDQETIQAILELDNQRLPVNHNTACGLLPIRIIIAIAQKLNWQPQLLHYTNSSKITGDTERAVGYGAIAFYEEIEPCH